MNNLSFDTPEGIIVLLTGPTGTGKTSVSWALLTQFGEMIFLDCDWFASRLPFSWENDTDLKSVFQALSWMIEFHLHHGRKNFVLSMTIQMAEHFTKYHHYFARWQLLMYAFRLRCEETELRRRIHERDRTHLQKQQEIQGIHTAQIQFDTLFPDNTIFQLIDTTNLLENEVAEKIVTHILKLR